MKYLILLTAGLLSCSNSNEGNNIHQTPVFNTPDTKSVIILEDTIDISKETIEGQDIYVLEMGTDFGYIVFIEEENLIRKLTRLQEECGVEIKGIVQVHYSGKSAIGDLVLFATELKIKKWRK